MVSSHCRTGHMSKQPVRRRTQEERRRSTTQRILRAAFKVMKKRGYAGFRIAEVADAAQVSRGAVLHHFPDKDALILATFEDMYRRGHLKSQQRAKKLPFSGDPLQAIIGDGSDFFFSDYFWTMFEVSMAAGRDKKFKRKSEEIARRYRLPVEAVWLDVLCQAGLPDDDAEDVLWLTLAIVRGLAMRTRIQDDPKRFAHLLDLWRGIFWTYWSAQQDALAGKSPLTNRRTAQAAASA
jgi:AcrR family transcriptional regulator